MSTSTIVVAGMPAAGHINPTLLLTGAAADEIEHLIAEVRTR